MSNEKPNDKPKTEGEPQADKKKVDGPVRVPVRHIFFKPGEMFDFPGTGVSQVSNIQCYTKTGPGDRPSPWTAEWIPAWQNFEVTFTPPAGSPITRMLWIGHVGTWERA